MALPPICSIPGTPYLPTSVNSPSSTRNPSMISQASSQETSVIPDSPARSFHGANITQAINSSEGIQNSLFSNEVFEIDRPMFDGIGTPEVCSTPSKFSWELNTPPLDAVMSDNWIRDQGMVSSNLDAQMLTNFDFVQ